MRRAIALVVLLVGGLVGGASPVAAHSDLEFTVPTDGATVGEPLSEITVGFGDPVTLIGPGFEVLDPQGNVLTPFAVTDDDMVFRLQLDPPIGGGDAAVRFEVRAEDGHTISGGFSFTILADAPTTTMETTIAPSTLAPTTTAAPSTTSPSSTTTSTSLTVGSTTTSPPTGTSEPPADDDASSTGLYVGLAVAAALLAGVFLVVRSRSIRTG